MKTRLLAIGLVLNLGVGLFAQTATAPSVGDGSSGNPYQIATLENLYWISQNSDEWSKYYIQTADIDASVSSGWDGAAGWSPIGNNTTQFTGSYNGQDYTISNLYLNRPSTFYHGLFGFTNNATVQNTGVTNATININSSDGQDYVGGLVGKISTSTVSNCYSTGNVKGGGWVGGLVGSNDNSSTVINCYSTASVEGTEFIGGLVGYNYGSCTVNKCYSTGSISSIACAGGLLGWNGTGATVSNCYSRCDVNRSSGDQINFGGFAGHMANIQYCYSTSNVNCGGLTDKGFVSSGSGISTGNFWDEEASNQTTAIGATAKTTAEMKTPSNFTNAGWDFTTVWEIIGTNYPTLRSNPDYSLPVGLVSFSAKTGELFVVLNWTTESEVDNLGYILERSGKDGIWVQIASYQTNKELQIFGNTSSATDYCYTDATVEPGYEYFYRLSDMSTQGKMTRHAPITVSFKTDNTPQTTEMENAYPNPFNPQTYIAYRLAENTDVKITVFDLLGRSVKELFNGHQSAGSYHVYWSGTTESGMKAPSGNYIIQMQTENATQVQKVMFMK